MMPGMGMGDHHGGIGLSLPMMQGIGSDDRDGSMKVPVSNSDCTEV